MKNKILNWITNLYNNVAGFFLNQFRTHAEEAINIVQNLKMVLDTNIPDIITALIPGQKDDLLVAYMRELVPPILEKTIITLNIVKANNQKSKIIEKGLEYLKGSTKEQKTLFYVTFAAELNVALADGKISFSEAIILSQLVYKQMKK